MYKYYYALEFFPIPEKHLTTYKKVRSSGQSPSIKNTIGPGIFEVDDEHLFYTTLSDEFNVLIYEFLFPEQTDIKVRVVKYKQIRLSKYSVCIKSTHVLPNVFVLNSDFITDILKPATFDINLYCQMTDPSFLVKKDGTTVDIISEKNALYAVIKNFGREIGTFKTDKQLFLKGELVDNTVYVFDAFIIDGNPLDFPYKQRMKMFDDVKPSITLVKNTFVTEIIASNIHDSFAAAWEESSKIKNDGIIIQDEFNSPLKWKPNKANTIDVLVEGDLFLSKNMSQVVPIKAVFNDKFNFKMIWEYRNKYPGEIIEIGLDGSFHKIRFDKNGPNALRTYKETLKSDNLIDKDTLISPDKLLPYVFNSAKEKYLRKYVHGETIEININCATINTINTLIDEKNILTINPLIDDSFNCNVVHEIKKPLSAIEYEKLNYDTIVISLPNFKTTTDDFAILDNLSKMLTSCKKIIIFDEFNQLDYIKKRLADFEIMDSYNLKDFANKKILSTDKLGNCNILVVKSKTVNIKSDFIFVVGLMGSGKSRLINEIRNFIHPLTAINLINIDNDVVKYISYLLNPSEQIYKSIRQILNPVIDKQIQSLIAVNQSVLLETTHIDVNYALEIKKSHRITAIICDTTEDRIKSNIEMRNKVNIRKTTFGSEAYKKFKEEILTYPKFMDGVYKFDIDGHKLTNQKTGGTERKIYLKVSDLTEEKEYVHKYRSKFQGVHYGQRKLVITEIMFLTMFTDPDKFYNVIYAGSAPSSKFPVLLGMFKNCRFILIDPNPFSENVKNQQQLYFKGPVDFQKIKDSPAIKTVVINDLCTMDLMSKLSSLENILFMSDIRTNLINDGDLEYDVLFNTAQHKAWLDVLYQSGNKIPYMLKSRTLYKFQQNEDYHKFLKIVSGIEEWNKYKNELLDAYNSHKAIDIAGERYLQPWPGMHSTEIRIIGDNPEFIIRNSIADEKRMFYYNTELRATEASQKISGVEAFGLEDVDPKIVKNYCGCNDCGIEIHWIKEYVKKYACDVNKIVELINKYSQSIENHKSGESKFYNFTINNAQKKIINESLYKNEFV